MLKKRQLQNIFSDKASLVLRALLREPDRQWTVPDLAALGVSFGMASIVLNEAERAGYVERLRIGPGSFSRLLAPEALLADWLQHYRFDRNLHTWYYYPGNDFLEKCIVFLQDQGIKYSLTLFSASRLVSPYVKDERDFLYIDVEPQAAPAFLRRIETTLDLKVLAKGGNVCFALPFYKSSVFSQTQEIKGYKRVSNLQLYLDLMGFPPGGPEEAQFLKKFWEETGEKLA
jgi:hypothetical protein